MILGLSHQCLLVLYPHSLYYYLSLSLYLSLYVSIYICIYLSIYLRIDLSSIYLCICMFMYRSISLSIDLSIIYLIFPFPQTSLLFSSFLLSFSTMLFPQSVQICTYLTMNMVEIIPFWYSAISSLLLLTSKQTIKWSMCHGNAALLSLNLWDQHDFKIP
jgi:hypothetical protein